MAVCYSIRDWDAHFEIAQSRKVVRNHHWVATPCKHDGKSFRRLMLMSDGTEIYGAWMLIVQIAAKCPTRGVLRDGDGPLTVEDMAIKTGCPTAIFERALNVLCSQQIGWMLVAQWECGGSTLPTQTDSTDNTKPTNQPPNPPEAAPNAPTAVPGEGGQVGGKVFALSWEAVAKRLAALGLVQFQKAVDDAKAAGSDPQRCHWLLDHAERYNFGPGAIAKRFAVASPSLGINSGWPNTDRPESVAEKRAQREYDQRAQRAAESAESETTALIKRAQRAGKGRGEILAELEAAKLPCPEWFVNPPQPLTDDERQRLRKAVGVQ